MKTKKETYYKVLVKGRSCHGGDMKWPLPTRAKSRWEPGAWIDYNEPCIICEKGLHVTTAPFSWYKIDCDVYEAEIGRVFGRENDKLVTNKVRLIRPVPHPKWWTNTLAFIASIKNVAWFSNGELGEHPKIKLFPTRDAAGDAAWAAAGESMMRLTADFNVAQKHRDHMSLRWSVWTAGYGVYCDVNGVLYCYRKP